MADNWVQYHREEYEAMKARKEAARKKRLHRYLVAYRKRLAEQKKAQEAQALEQKAQEQQDNQEGKKDND